jgi:tRNA nucleotidyltransferase (CCA-adding enzyme)
VLLPEIDANDPLPMQVVDTAARLKASLAVRFACLTGGFGRGKGSVASLQALCERWRVPVEIRELAEMVAREHSHIDESGALDAAGLVRLLERCDAFRKPARFAEALLACECAARSRPGTGIEADAPWPQRQRLLAVLATASAVATDVVARAAQQSGATGPKIGEAIHRARVEAVASSLGQA